MTNLNDALRLAGLGWHVFALGPTGHPYPNCRECKTTCTVQADYDACDHLTCHATYAGTTDPDKLTAVWEKYPQSLIGVRTGAPSGIIVFDFDVHSDEKDGKATFRELKDVLPRTVTAYTGGGGMHLYYQHPGRNVPNDNRGKLGLGLDVKGDGGYVIAAPSAKRGKDAYRWHNGRAPWEMGTAILDLKILDPLWREQERRSLDVNENGEVIVSDHDRSKLLWDYETALDVLGCTGAGSRNENLYRAACRGGECLAAQLIKRDTLYDQLTAAGIEAGLAEREIHQTIRSGVSRGIADLGGKQ